MTCDLYDPYECGGGGEAVFKLDLQTLHGHLQQPQQLAHTPVAKPLPQRRPYITTNKLTIAAQTRILRELDTWD